jgi:transposase
MAISSPNKYRIYLNAEQRERLLAITRNGHSPAKKIRHAQVLLWSDENREEGRISSPKIAEQLGMHVNTVDRIRKRFSLEGEMPALNRKVRETPPIQPKIDGRAEAFLIATCCGPPPEGRSRWTLTLLGDELKKRGFVTSVCAETVRRKLKKINYNPGANKLGVYPSEIKPALSRKWKGSLTCIKRSTANKSR